MSNIVQTAIAERISQLATIRKAVVAKTPDNAMRLWIVQCIDNRVHVLQQSQREHDERQSHSQAEDNAKREARTRASGKAIGVVYVDGEPLRGVS